MKNSNKMQFLLPCCWKANSLLCTETGFSKAQNGQPCCTWESVSKNASVDNKMIVVADGDMVLNDLLSPEAGNHPIHTDGLE